MAEKTYLDEATVERVAVEHLARYYAEAYPGPVYSTRQFYLKQRMGVADGFIVARKENDQLVTASIEAKSRKTLGDILPSPDEDIIWGATAVLAFTMGALCALIGYLAAGWIWSLISFVLGFLPVWFLLPRVLRRRATFQRISMIDDRLAKYEANERWLALPEDAYSELSSDHQYKIVGRCLNEGVGIVLVSADLRAIVIVKPAYYEAKSGRADYLDRYVHGQEVMNSLLQQSVS